MEAPAVSYPSLIADTSLRLQQLVGRLKESMHEGDEEVTQEHSGTCQT